MKVVYRLLLILLFAATGALILSCACPPRFKRYKIDLAAFYADKSAVRATDLTKGKYIIGFFSPSCKHCRQAALAMHNLKEKNPAIPFFMFLCCTANSSTDSTNLHDFWAESHAQNIPYACLDLASFINNAGGGFPLILWVNDGWVEANTSNNALDMDEVENWLK